MARALPAPAAGGTTLRLRLPVVRQRLLLLLLRLSVLLAVVPTVATDYWLSSILIPVIVMELAGIGLNLLMGYVGLVSLGSAAFTSVGAFATHNIILRLPFLPLPAALVLA